MSAKFYASEIISRSRLEALNGEPFWYVYGSRRYDLDGPGYVFEYFVERLYNYRCTGYPLVQVFPTEAAGFSRVISLALCRQDSEYSRNEQRYALGDIKDLKALTMKLKLLGFPILLKDPPRKLDHYSGVKKPRPLDLELLEKMNQRKYTRNEETL